MASRTRCACFLDFSGEYRRLPSKTAPGRRRRSSGPLPTRAIRYLSIPLYWTPSTERSEIVSPALVAGHGRRSVSSRRRISIPWELSTVRRRHIFTAHRTTGSPGHREKRSRPTPASASLGLARYLTPDHMSSTTARRAVMPTIAHDAGPRRITSTGPRPSSRSTDTLPRNSEVLSATPCRTTLSSFVGWCHRGKPRPEADQLLLCGRSPREGHGPTAAGAHEPALVEDQEPLGAGEAARRRRSMTPRCTRAMR